MIQEPWVKPRRLDVARPMHNGLVRGGARVLTTFVLTVSAVVPIAADPAHAATACPTPNISWDAPGNGDWHDAANWTGDVLPTGDDDVCIPAGVTVTITDDLGTPDAAAGRLFSEGILEVDEFAVLDLTDSSEVDELRLAGTLAGTGSLTILGTGSEWSDGAIDNDVIVADGAELEISGSDGQQTKWVNGSLTNHGAVNQSGTRLNLGTVVNHGTWLLTHPFNATVFSGGAFTNFGTVERPVGAGGTLADIISTVEFASNGIVAANAGTVQIANLVELGDGASLVAGAGAELFVLSRGVVAIGNATVGGEGVVEFRSGDYSINPGAALTVVDGFELRGGDIQGPGMLAVTGEASLIQGEISGNAEVTSSGHLAITPSSSGVDISGRLVNNGLVTQSDDELYAGPDHGAITNNGLWQMTNTTVMNFLIRGIGNVTGSFVNNGTLEGSPTAGSGLHTSLDLENNGTVAARSGLFRIRTASANLSGTTLTGGRWEIRNGSSMQLPGAVTENAAEILLSGSGATSGQLTDLTANTGSLELGDGASFTTTGAFTNAGLIVTGAGSTFAATGALTLGTGSIVDFGVAGPSLVGQITAASVALGGTLAAHAVGGYVPAVSESHLVMSYGSGSGDFATLAIDPFYDAEVQPTATFLVGLDPEPIADAGPDQTVSEGDGVVLDGSMSTDPGGVVDTWSWADTEWFIDSTAPMPTFTHTADDGEFTVTLEVCDTAAQCDQDQAVVTVTNVDPVVTPVGPLTAEEGAPIAAGTVLATFEDPGSGDTHTSTIDWGDGSSEPGPTTSPIIGSHTYPASGSYTVTVTVTDDDGGSDQATVAITVANVAPTVTPATPTIAEGDATPAVLGTVDDPGSETFTGTMNWDDGSKLDSAITVDASSQALGGHAYADNGSYAGSLCITDTDGATGCAIVDIIVTNVAPTVVLAQPSVAAPAGPDVTVIGTYQDPGAADTHTATIDWKDGPPDVGVPVNGGAFSFDHTYSAPGTYQVDVCIVDDDGDSGCDSVTVEAGAPANTPPSVDPGGPYIADEGVRIVLAGSASDGDIGDMVESTEWTSDPAAVFDDPAAVDTGFTALQDGTYDVTLSATDSNGETASATTQVVVRNRAPALTSRVFLDTFEGTPVQMHATYSDPGVLDVHTARVNWFDPNAFEPAIVDQDANTIFSTHVYPQNRISEVNLCVADELVEFCNATLITIANVAPEIAPFQLVGPQTEGSAIDLSVVITDPGTDDPLTTTIDWGEGAGSEDIAATRTDTGGTVNASNHYERDGVYSVELCATDDLETTCRTESVTIRNVAPDVEAGPDVTIDVGGQVSLAASFVDPGADTWSATVTWGDGTDEQPAAVDPSKAVNGRHTYTDDGTFTATVCVFDGAEAGCDSFAVTVSAASEGSPPKAQAGGPYRAKEGSSVKLNGTRSSDPDGQIVSYRWTTDGGSFDNANSAKPRFRASDNGTYRVTLTVTDDDGLTDTVRTTVKVRNVRPRVNAGKDQKINKGDRFRLEAKFTDPGTADTHRAIIDWGDGDKTRLDRTGSPIVEKHRYDKPGRYRVKVTVIDDDGGKHTDTLTLTVNKKRNNDKRDDKKGDTANGEKTRRDRDRHGSDRDKKHDHDKQDDHKGDRDEKRDHNEKHDRDKKDDKNGDTANGEKARQEKDKHGSDRDKKHDRSEKDDHKSDRDKKRDRNEKRDHDKKHDRDKKDDHKSDRDEKRDRDGKRDHDNEGKHHNHEEGHDGC